MRDAATDPQPGDHLPPIKRTPQTDPMGPDCISPEVWVADYAKSQRTTVEAVMRQRFPHLYR